MSATTPSVTESGVARSRDSWPRMVLIGCGAIAERFYLPALTRHRDVMRNLIIIDRNIERAEEMSSIFEAREYSSDFRNHLGDIDGAIVAVPTHLHYDISTELSTRGIHVLCEKPLAESADDARAMIDAAHASGAILATNYQMRIYPNLVKVRDLLSKGLLGAPLSIDISVADEFDWPALTSFRFMSRSFSGGVLRDRGSHILDVICWWLGGKPRLVSSQNDSFGGSEGIAHVKLRLSMCTVNVRLNWFVKSDSRFLVRCEKGTISGSLYDHRGVTVESKDGRKERKKTGNGPMKYSEMAYAIVSNFIDAISKNNIPIVRGSDVVDSLQLIDECYANATQFDMPWYEPARTAHAS